MGEYFFKIAALLCHTARSVLAHTDAVPVTAHGKYEFENHDFISGYCPS